MKVLFVCTGNSCRSVMAQFLFNKLAQDKGLSSWEAKSCGTAAQPRFPIPSGVKSSLSARGIDPVQHVPQIVSPRLMEWADRVLAMARGHEQALKSMHPAHAHKIRLFSEEAGFGKADIEDPIGRSEEIYADTCAQIERFIQAVIAKHADSAQSR